MNMHVWWSGYLSGARSLSALLLLASTFLLAGCEKEDVDVLPIVPPSEELCHDVVCKDNATCDANTGVCGCDAGYKLGGEQCVVIDTPASGCSVDADCNDGLACNGDETCNPDTKSCDAGTAIDCGSEGICDEATLECFCRVGFEDFGEGCVAKSCTSDRDCDDQNACNGDETCDLALNTCVAAAPIACDVFNEICDPVAGCICPDGYKQDRRGVCEQIRCTDDADCDNGLLCDGVEVCDLASNRCRPGENVVCPARNDCTEVDGSCECKPGFAPDTSGNGSCVAHCTEDIHCGELSICGVTQICNLTNNRCVNGIELCGPGSVCDPLAPEGERCQCAVGFKFDEAQDKCIAIGACIEDSDCDDGIFCNGEEQCGDNGRCLGTTFSPLFIGTVLCPINGFCSEDAEACVCKDGYIPVDGACVEVACTTDVECDDGIFCNGAETCDVANNQCVTGSAPACGTDERCHEGSQTCTCAPGFEDLDGDCVAIRCTLDSDCAASGDLCDGALACNTDTEFCEAHNPVDCGKGFCVEDAGDTYCQCSEDEALVNGKCVLACPVPQAPVMAIIQEDSVLNFTAPAGYAIEISELGATESDDYAVWSSAGSVDLAQAKHNPLRVIARASGNGCQLVHEFDWTYDLVEDYPSTPTIANQRNLSLNAIPAYLQLFNGGTNETRPLNTAYRAWATGYEDLQYGTHNDSVWRKPEKVYGRPRGTFGIIVLGNDGRITVTFDKPITNGPGPDFAVFENGFISGVGVNAEVAYVEVSSDGKNFLRFDTHCLVPENPDGYGTMAPHQLNNLPGIQPAYYGTPFDLSELRNRPEVLNGTVDLERITHVRVLDIVGDRDNLDSFGNVIHDATPTFGSGGFDLDAVGVFNVYEGTP